MRRVFEGVEGRGRVSRGLTHGDHCAAKGVVRGVECGVEGCRGMCRGLVSRPGLGRSDGRTVGRSDCRTIGRSDCRTSDCRNCRNCRMYCRTVRASSQGNLSRTLLDTVGRSHCRTCRTVGLLSDTVAASGAASNFRARPPPTDRRVNTRRECVLEPDEYDPNCPLPRLYNRQ